MHSKESKISRQKNEFTPCSLVEIQNFIFPDVEICEVEKMFFRANGKVTFDYEKKSLMMSKGGIVRFDTYFNGFFLDKWKEYTRIESVEAYLKINGSFRINVYNIDVFAEVKSLLCQRFVSSESLQFTKVLGDLQLSDYSGMIYIEAEALGDGCQIEDGYIGAYTEQNNDIKVSVVICTYKREAYVSKNVQLLNRSLLSDDVWKNRLEVFIIDNGKTLEGFGDTSISVIPNKNAGGSGGFARGMIESLKQERGFTHILLMDDDIVFDPLIIKRLWSFLSVSNHSNICFGGSMLRQDKKYLQYERGSVWDKNKGFVGRKRNIDLRNTSSILFNEVNEFIDYSAWWFFCFPVEAIKDYGFPYPFFIRMDDVEFGKRISSQYKTVILNSLCVWHEPFENKHSAVTEYYYHRNLLIFNSIYHSKDFSATDAIKSFLKPVLRELFLYRYETASKILDAVSDYLKSPEHLKNTNPEMNHKQVSNFKEKAVKDTRIEFVFGKYLESESESESGLKRFLRYLTLNGHLLPYFLLRNGDNVEDKGYRVVPFLNARPLNVFRARRVLYYKLQTQEGFTVEFSRISFFKTLFRTIWLTILILARFSSLKSQYIISLSRFTTEEFWIKYLEITDKSN
jgi:galactofuranosylgalactofuranosylrhamnosyl-N-acetylglucosaminyl-diphospho-decaprenol beta-1,5/1,6-galactofuranosyltransferase